jgi:formamidopyrimidine-DNA glycosylase
VPELPDITVYIEAIEKRILGQTLERVRIAQPFLLRTAVPPLANVEGREVVSLRRVGKRIAFGLAEDFWLVLHLMIAGRLHWVATGGRISARKVAATFHFQNGTLTLTEAGTKKRASLHLVQGVAALGQFDRGGLEIMGCSLTEFTAALTRENHTLKRALTDPTLFSGIGNAYSDEILHAARLSPVALTRRMLPEQMEVLHQSTQIVLALWMDRLRKEIGDGFPEHVTAFRTEMAVHGKFGQLCLVCGAKVQRIRYADNETNYCPGCQTGGRLLADRSLSLLLKKDWPKTAEELEEIHRRLDRSRGP